MRPHQTEEHFHYVRTKVCSMNTVSRKGGVTGRTLTSPRRYHKARARRRLRGGTTDADDKRSTHKLEREGHFPFLYAARFILNRLLVHSRPRGSKTEVEFDLDNTAIFAFQDC